MDEYREGKVKRTPVRGVKEYLKPFAYNLWKLFLAIEGVTAYLLHNESVSYSVQRG